MAEQVVIEGTVTPSTFLATGERRSVSRTGFVEKLIAKGFVRVVDQPAPAPTVAEKAPVEEATAESATGEGPAVVQSGDIPVPPSPNARRNTWAKFFDTIGLDYPAEATRDELVDIYTTHTSSSGE
ncbi:hypothetical protein OED52_13635 [Rhodococcus sp. Z13]|uniref:Uncharacterized protein n=1 Tax=Rhodococcus sacchari TaxID=2962047 RepID=A0ACD4DDH0_9NOCA|nr:hypothetical protein [Rhodococcus sp. Z13]UYP17713.1 hypothetical protein OED52_13635 [Rhodococcus sp. Z13]